MILRGFVFLILCLFVAACGKKAPPTMKAFEVPAAPQKLGAVHRGGAINLSWTYEEKLRSGIKGFHVLRSEGGVFDVIAAVKSDQSSFADRTYSIGSSYRYKVIAESLRNVLSEDSAVLPVMPKPLPHPPAQVRIAAGPGFIDLSWSGVGEGVCYNIYKSKEKGRYGDLPLNREAVCGTSFRDSSLSPETSVYYTVRSLLNTIVKDEGMPSAEVEASPDIFVPSAPTNLTIVTGLNKRYLVWQESPEPWIRGYLIYRKGESESTYRALGESRIPTFVDSEKITGKFQYAVKAKGPSRESEPLSGEIFIEAEKDVPR